MINMILWKSQKMAGASFKVGLKHSAPCILQQISEPFNRTKVGLKRIY